MTVATISSSPHTTMCGCPGILSALAVKSLEELQQLLGADASEALADLQQLWVLAEGYGYADWLVFDASVVRGLAYYTGGAAGGARSGGGRGRRRRR